MGPPWACWARSPQVYLSVFPQQHRQARHPWRTESRQHRAGLVTGILSYFPWCCYSGLADSHQLARNFADSTLYFPFFANTQHVSTLAVNFHRYTYETCLATLGVKGARQGTTTHHLRTVCPQLDLHLLLLPVFFVSHTNCFHQKISNITRKKYADDPSLICHRL